MKAQHNALVNVGRDLDEPITDGGIMSAVGHHASTLYPEHVQAFRMYWKGIISRLESTSYTKIPEMAYRGHLTWATFRLHARARALAFAFAFAFAFSCLVPRASLLVTRYSLLVTHYSLLALAVALALAVVACAVRRATRTGFSRMRCFSCSTSGAMEDDARIRCTARSSIATSMSFAVSVLRSLYGTSTRTCRSTAAPVDVRRI